MVYETLWIRIFGLVFGNTTYAVSIVLAVFMSGCVKTAFGLSKRTESEEIRANKKALIIFDCNTLKKKHFDFLAPTHTFLRSRKYVCVGVDKSRYSAIL